ncbi:MAG: aromatic ring-hydroxylating oxygenase subunit alpha, partial [Acidimicrobiales bacterium]
MSELTERLAAEMRWEQDRTGPPDGFPAFPDIPTGRYLSDEFWALERDHLWSRTWVLAGRAE